MAEKNRLNESRRYSNVTSREGAQTDSEGPLGAFALSPVSTDEMRELRTIRYEQLRPTVDRADPAAWCVLGIPLCDKRARVLGVRGGGLLMIRDAGVPSPVADIETGKVTWPGAHMLRLLCVLDSQPGRVVMLPDGVGRLVGALRNDCGTWNVFVFAGRQEVGSALPPRRAEPQGRSQSASGSDRSPSKARAACR